MRLETLLIAGILAIASVPSRAQSSVVTSAAPQDTTAAPPKADSLPIRSTPDTVVHLSDTLSGVIIHPPTVWLIDDYPLVQARLAELNGTGPAYPVLRSTSSLLWADSHRPNSLIALLPQVQFVRNSAIPYSRNDGGLWAGRGSSSRVAGGVAIKLARLSIVLAPEITTIQNDSFPARATNIIPRTMPRCGRASKR